jgi:hypothetical protein
MPCGAPIRVCVDRVGPNLKSSSSAEAQNELAHQGLNAMEGRPLYAAACTDTDTACPSAANAASSCSSREA